MSPSRRDFLKYTGATSLLLASSELKSPRACSSSSVPNVNGWPGMSTSWAGVSLIRTKTPLFAPPL